MRLFRPVGRNELSLIYDSSFKKFPPRLPGQPFFYPVLNANYADQITKEWNTKNAEAGFVTSFDVNSDFTNKYEIQTVGSYLHKELWIPSEELDEFNEHIEGNISVTIAYFSKGYTGYIPESFGLKGRDSITQFIVLAQSYPFDLFMEISANHKAVFLNYPHWRATDFTDLGISEHEKAVCLDSIKSCWNNRFPNINLVENTGIV